MHIRPFEDSDLDCLERVTDGFPVPSPHNIIVGRAVEHDGRLIGYGVVKHHGEAIFAADTSQPRIVRAKALQALMEVAISGATKARCEQLHVFMDDRKLADSLIKHYGFVETKSQIVLVRNL